jgi:predicted esterase
MSGEFIHQFVPGKLPFTVLLLHGTGGDENDLLPVGRGLAPGAALLSPRGKVEEHGALRFFARSAPGVFDENEIRQRAAELAEWIGLAVKQYSLDAARLYALGYSNGANIAMAVMLLHPGVIAGGALLRPMKVIEPEPLPDLNGAPILIVAGKNDMMMPPREAEGLARLLTGAGAAVDFAMQDAGHDLTPQDFALGKRWFAQLITTAV